MRMVRILAEFYDVPTMTFNTKSLWKLREDLFATSGKIFDFDPEYRKENSPMQDAAALRSEAARMLQRAHKIEKFSVADDFDEGALLRWRRSINDKQYSYAAIKVENQHGSAVWYLTGEHSSSSLSWSRLVTLWLDWDVNEVEVFTGGPSWVLGRDEKPVKFAEKEISSDGDSA
jgi:hypothetical protein